MGMSSGNGDVGGEERGAEPRSRALEVKRLKRPS
jgi:hypothetical protein